MREREAKFDEYDRPKGERSKEESKKSTKQKDRLCLMNTARPKDQKQQQHNKIMKLLNN